MEPDYPSIARRYLATFIDGMFVIFVMIVAASVFQEKNELSTILRVGIVLVMFFVYEPLCTSKFCTVGQSVMKIRVRKHDSYERISIPSAYIRFITKLFLGIISFFSIPFTEEKRGIHDFAVNSVVICADSDL